MPWRDSSPMDLKTQFIADYLRQTLSVSELCYHYNISRKTGYNGSTVISRMVRLVWPMMLEIDPARDSHLF